MKVKLVRMLREQDHTGYTKDLARYFKDVELLIEPQRKMRIEVNNISFFIDRIEQDLNTQIVILYEYIDINHYDNRDNEGFKEERKILSDDGWKLYN